MRLSTFAALIAVTGGTLATPAAAQTGQALIRHLFTQLEADFRDKGKRMTQVAAFQNGIEDGSSRGDIVSLDRGQTYWIVGVCDEDCSDFDLEVKDSNAVVVGSDVLDDDAPIVVLENVRGGAYQVRSVMADCSADPCLTGVRVYRAD